MDNSYAYEKLGLFYLGRELEIGGEEGESMPLLLKSKNLTTHTAIIGMTGSGKTGLGIGLIEEAIMDDIPSIIIDPKGDMGNLLLNFPELKGADFTPWVDPVEAEKSGLTIEEYATREAQKWKEGLNSWGQGGQRIAQLREKTSFTIYTPGSSAGVPVSVLDSFAAPGPEILEDTDTLNGMVNSAVTGLLALAGLKSSDTKSREYVLLSSLFLHHWRKGEGLDMEALIGGIVNPPFKKIGVFGLDTFYPQSERMELALQFNGVIASPAFASWTKGCPLDIQRILYDEEGKPRTAIFCIAHLSESERMFFVTMLLNRFIGWMRRQQGSSTLKALLYMDEIFGYFPPTANPPSKKPMLLLLKQARAFGVGVVLATQNPVDLDYKGLSNIGTWFVGRLQTAQDQNRVIDGIAGSDGLDKKELRELLSDMKGRQFLLRSAHLDEVKLFATRWVMSYLKGPISLLDVEKLMDVQKSSLEETSAEKEISRKDNSADGLLDHRPLLADSIPQRFFLHPVEKENHVFEPWLAARGSVRFYNNKRNIDEVIEVSQRIYLDEGFDNPDWQDGEENPYTYDEMADTPPGSSSYYPLPANLTGRKDLRGHTKKFSDFLYQNKKLELFRISGLKLESVPGEELADFRVRATDVLRERKDEEVVKLEEKYRVKQARLEDRMVRAAQKIEKEKADVKARTTDTILSFGAAVLGAFFGRKKVSASTLSKASTGIKSAGRLAREKGEVNRAKENLAGLEADMESLTMEIQEKINLIGEKYILDDYTVETFAIKPRRSDIFDLELCLLWEMVP